MSLQVSVIVALVALGLGLDLASAVGDLNFRQCGPAKIKSLRIEGCSAADCTFKLGQEYMFEATFVPSLSLSTPIVSINTKRGLLEHSKADWGVEMPAAKAKEQQVAYKAVFDTPEPMGPMKFTVEDEGEWPNFCVEFSAQIVA